MRRLRKGLLYPSDSAIHWDSMTVRGYEILPRLATSS